MDRFAAHIVATAVLTIALAAIPTAMAQPAPSSSSSAAPSSPRAPKPAPTATQAPAQTLASPSAPSKADAPEWRRHGEHRRHMIALPANCPDVFQVGPTRYARWHGEVAFSVKQFYSPRCRARFGYAHPWLGFRAAQVHFDLGMAEFDLTHDTIDGARTFIAGAGGPDFWSNPVVVPAGTCTEGLVHVFFPDDETDTFTDTYCA